MAITLEPEPATLWPANPRTPELPRARRRRVVGADVWIEAPSGSDAALDAARAAAFGTHLRLSAAVDGAGEPARGTTPTVVRARFVGRDPEGHLTDAAIAELLLGLGHRLRWSEVSKLEEFDGIPDYVPLPH
jgi:hypothetical protein